MPTKDNLLTEEKKQVRLREEAKLREEFRPMEGGPLNSRPMTQYGLLQLWKVSHSPEPTH